ncbi:hypothetical protein P4S72_11330 [Vibrio sp. PP-XX7]
MAPGAAHKMGLGWVLLAMVRESPPHWLTCWASLVQKFAIEARRH